MSQPFDDIILHICPQTLWEAAQAAGAYRGDTLDTEGFIHCSTAAQMGATANRFFAGQHGLVLLYIEVARLTAEVKWEPALDTLFPHIYGPLNLDAVLAVEAIEPDEAGVFHYPPPVSNPHA